MFAKFTFLLAIIASLTAPAEKHTYVRTMEVTQLNYAEDIVTCTDPAGYIWEFYGCEDYAEHDLISCIMDTNGTEETILDDAIIETSFTGYWKER